ncbi:DevR family CRISPR-associated autoregulator [Anoxybacteroides tepidamans]|uniref:DevR family CRISPR-associated autoregulator n=1 Tax=Anoxybacteroides tepidamans TaxID=265948 RepID=UPI00047F152C|nr:DevR family CRISPR-associated autoregulator [Anoxybacillus tepidamans]
MISSVDHIKLNDYLFRLNFILRFEVDAEALNNEETIGNVVKTRTIQLRDGSLRNAITGNLIKHVFTKNVRLLTEHHELCDTCKIFSPMKNGKIKVKDERLSANGNRVKECAVDDLCGFMNAGKGQNEKRYSVAQFSWAIAREGTRNDSVLYTRVDPTEKNAKTKKEQADTLSDANTNKDQNAQMIFYRPIRSSEYALTIQLDLHRVGFDDEKLMYAVDHETIKRRIKNALKAVRNTLVDIEGAMCSTNLPHLRGVYGIVTEKTDREQITAKYSALNEDFIEVNQKLSTVSHTFNNIQQFKELIELYASDEFLDFMIQRNMEYVKTFHS